MKLKAKPLPKSGFVVCQDLPILGASPDAKVIDTGCRDTYGLDEVKCPESKFRVTPVEACSDLNLFLQLIDGKPRLKRNHHYYAQVQRHNVNGVTSLFTPAKACA